MLIDFKQWFIKRIISMVNIWGEQYSTLKVLGFIALNMYRHTDL